jgi:1-deoxy-D-xylulose-5-phosphate synthase
MADDSILERIQSPDDLKSMKFPELAALCGELRDFLIRSVSQTGGHLSSNLGVVELAVALHRAFQMPEDKLVWDVGHQCYVHKILTGRMAQFSTLRQEDGISGFPRPCESPCDTFIAGHSSTSVSAANGMAKAKALTGEDGYVVAIIGDGALTGGLAYEGLSNAGRSKDRLIVVLNDNRMSISCNVGFVARYLAHLRVRPRYVRFKNAVGNFLSHIPLIGKGLYNLLIRVKTALKNSVYKNSSMFEEMGFHYLGPIDGHNLKDLTKALETAKRINKPVLLHVETVKGKGYSFAMESPDTYHGVGKFDVETGQTPPAAPSFSSVFGGCLTRLAEEDPNICAITAAMLTGTCLQEFADKYPKRLFDVGIAEEHAVTFASGLACGGILPVFAVYSTFLQRSYDQILNDTSIINNHIVLAIDRAGLVPDDGETHQGIFDVPFLSTIPHVTIYSPFNFAELEINLKQALYDVGGIAAVRYPKGGELPCPKGYKPNFKPYSYLRSGKTHMLLVTYGRIFANVLSAAKILASEGFPVSVLKLTRILPLDEDCVQIARRYSHVLFFEEGSRRGGIGEYMGSLLMRERFSGEYRIQAIDGFPPHASTEAALRRAGLDVEGILLAARGPKPEPEEPEHAEGEPHA